jgi:CBS-domain-containing membrane protein
MMRLKGKTGRQKVTVEHVHVHSGGQAIVGTVTARELDKGEGDGRTNRWNTPCKAARVAKERQATGRLKPVPTVRSKEPTRELVSVSSDEQRAV